MEHVILHPLPLIAISDYVVRHTLRQLSGPVVGALFGQQKGREISIEFAYEVLTLVDGDKVTLDMVWFDERIEQGKLPIVSVACARERERKASNLNV